MTEGQPFSETRGELLKTATQYVANCYYWRYIRGEKRDYSWEEIAEKNPELKEEIRELGQRMDVVKNIKYSKTAPNTEDVIKPFLNVGSYRAKKFLVDVLLSRTSKDDYAEDYSLPIDYLDEAERMASEMGLREGWESEEAEEVTIYKVVRKVLEGELRIAYKPKKYLHLNNTVEGQQGLEAQKALLKEAIHDVKSRYVGGEAKGSWEELAQRRPVYGEKIRELGERMKEVSKVRRIWDDPYPGFITTSRIVQIPFDFVENPMAKNFLVDVLLSRIAKGRGSIDYNLLEKGKIHESMAFEMGLGEGWKSEEAKNLTLEDCMEKVLLGDMGIAYEGSQSSPARPKKSVVEN